MLVMELFRLEGGRGVVKDGLCGHMWCPTASLQTELQCRAITASFIPMSPSSGETIPGKTPLGSTLGPSAFPLQQEKCGHPYYLAAENRESRANRRPVGTQTRWHRTLWGGTWFFPSGAWQEESTGKQMQALDGNFYLLLLVACVGRILSFVFLLRHRLPI